MKRINGGNVWQWTADAYKNSYDGASTDGNVAVAGDAGSYRVIRGGSWVRISGLVEADDPVSRRSKSSSIS